MHSFISLLSLALLPLSLAQTYPGYTDAALVYTTNPIQSTIWTAGQSVDIAWTIPEENVGNPQGITHVTIELGYNRSVVAPTGLFVAPAPGVKYPETTRLTYTVPRDLVNGFYTLVFVGRQQGNATLAFGPNWSAAFEVRGGVSANATTTMTGLPTATTATVRPTTPLTRTTPAATAATSARPSPTGNVQGNSGLTIPASYKLVAVLMAALAVVTF
ncbi:hypothetical protein BC832DRAFT_556855 [Gaertneriomyces semiglobifer]|nr:hypothetical protein BC832DRAFT_556855 [Gaertneriomyces semiglobifer]